MADCSVHGVWMSWCQPWIGVMVWAGWMYRETAMRQCVPVLRNFQPLLTAHWRGVDQQSTGHNRPPDRLYAEEMCPQCEANGRTIVVDQIANGNDCNFYHEQKHQTILQITKHKNKKYFVVKISNCWLVAEQRFMLKYFHLNYWSLSGQEVIWCPPSQVTSFSIL